MISVCITTFNGERFIAEQLSSILHQLGDEDEIIISDDGSTDKTKDIVLGFQSPNIKWFVNKGKHGYTPNFENALKKAKGDVIFLCDQDDIWEPFKVAHTLNLLQTHDCVISDACIVNEQGEVIFPSFFEQRHSKGGLFNTFVRFSFLGCCMSFKRKVLETSIPFPNNHTLATHDNWIALMSFAFYKTYVDTTKTIRYRRHGANVSMGGAKSNTSFAFKLHYRLYLLKHLTLRFLRSQVK